MHPIPPRAPLFDWFTPEELDRIGALLVPGVSPAGEVWSQEDGQLPPLTVALYGEAERLHPRTVHDGAGRTIRRGDVTGQVRRGGSSTARIQTTRETGWLRLCSDAESREPELLALLDRCLEDQRWLETHLSGVLRRLRQVKHLGDIPLPLLPVLLRGARVAKLNAGDRVVDEVDRHRWWFLALDGPPLAGSTTSGLAGGLDEALAGEPGPTDLVATGATTLLRLPRRWLEYLAEHNGSFQRALRCPPSEELHSGGDSAQVPERVLIVPPAAHRSDSGAAALLAQGILSCFEEQVFLVRLRPAPGALMPTPPQPPATGSVRVVDLAFDPDDLQALGAHLRRWPATYVLVHLEGGDEALLAGLGAALDAALFLLGDAADLQLAESIDAPRRRYCTWSAAAQAPAVAAPRGASRLHLDLARHRGLPRLEELSADRQGAVERVARGLMDRRMGVALGGGGAWGYAHVALLRGLTERGIPVDLMSGVSIGAVVASWWATKGLAGLDQLVGEGATLGKVNARCVLWSGFMARWLRSRLGEQALEALELPTFPVATDLSHSMEHAFRSGSLPYAVRASCSFALLYSSTPGDGVRYVDGGFINNLPEDVLVAERAARIVGSNIVPAPRVRDPGPPPDTRVQRVLEALNPAQRMFEGVRAAMVLFHQVGQAPPGLVSALFENPPNTALPTDWSDAAEIVSTAASSAEMARTLDEAEAAWRSMGARPQRAAVSLAHG